MDTEVIVRNIRNCSNVIGPLTIGRLLTIFALQPEFEPVYRALIQFGNIDFVCCPASEALREAGEGVAITFGELISMGNNGAVPIGWVAPPARAGSEEEEGGLRRAAPSVILNPPKESVLPEGAEIIFLRREV